MRRAEADGDTSTSTLFLNGLGDCCSHGGATWLSARPVGFTLAPGKSRTVQVTLTATTAAGVTGPGVCSAETVLLGRHPVQRAGGPGHVTISHHMRPGLTLPEQSDR
ncbi:hypothetical protein HH310_20485 [Actinoplanes sp. TBRC 11911]|uniref:hypothetical protein n=1 Tax=Actinoplanes sp. TBRC 11911 TaxID=2729386 RepID=UPI00145DC6AF|nr:hypothetical protein [Actinoplanes sp. TBRC 11911]NMO53550.1 hypothetical protein [Actinoplanes sp. TBRC 11911]